MRRDASKDKERFREQEKQQELLSVVTRLIKDHEGERDFLVQVAGELNDCKIRTPTGREWTSKNLWAYLRKNRVVSYPEQTTEIPITVLDGAKEVIATAARLAELGSIMQWSCDLTGKKTEAVILSIDADVLELWKKKQELSGSSETLEQAFERFLREDLASDA